MILLHGDMARFRLVGTSFPTQNPGNMTLEDEEIAPQVNERNAKTTPIHKDDVLKHNDLLKSCWKLTLGMICGE